MAKINPKKTGQKLKNLRGNRTQDDIAKCLRISRSSYQMYENGERIPRDTVKVKLAKFYNVPVGSLFFDE